MTYYAHSKPGIDKSSWQLLIAHLMNTSALADELGRDAGLSELAQTAALFHDIGKYSEAFQRRLEGASQRVDHSTAGARVLLDCNKDDPNRQLIALLIAYCIIGHHTGLPDYGSPIDTATDGTLLARLKAPLEDYSGYQEDISIDQIKMPSRLAIRPPKGQELFSVSFLTRMMYSALVDADFMETETYMNDGLRPRGGYPDIATLCREFNEYLKRFDHPQTAINQKRTETLKGAMDKADHLPGYFTLTVPTGGGKTLTSMAFALNHAAIHGLKRIIYVIPYTSIIEQNAAVFKQCLGEDNVLEHHSNFDWQQLAGHDAIHSADNQTSDVKNKLKLAAENWNIPIVVTTNVQFFESLFASRSSRCRKLHNLAKSVIIFDEAQMLPRDYLEPCMNAVRELVVNYGSSVVFCTATQPSLARFFPGTSFEELTPDPQALFDFYQRVRVKDDGTLTDAELIERLTGREQTLCIVNTRKHAKGLFSLLAERLPEESIFHLSTLMCPAHRKKVLSEIRARLDAGQPCYAISTQILEAGIDIDFPVGFRALAGLDSIIQAAGRVNRENRRAEISDLHIFEPDSTFVKRIPAFIKQGADVTRSVLREFGDDPVSTRAISAYFQLLYGIQGKDAFDTRRIMSCFDKGTGEPEFDFKTAAEKFKLIDDSTLPVIIPYNEQASNLVKVLGHTDYPASLARQLQLFTVSIYEKEFEALESAGHLDFYAGTYAVLNDARMYDSKMGLIIPDTIGGDAIFI